MRLFLQRRAKKLFLNSLHNIEGGLLALVCPDKTYSFGDPSSQLRATAVVHDERFFLRAVSSADVGIGESYMDGDWSSPDLVALVRLVTRNLRRVDSGNRVFSLLRSLLLRWRHHRKGNSLKGSQRNIQAHYDVG